MGKKKVPQVRHRTRQGEGSFFWREDKQRWQGVIDVGWTERGTRKRRTISDANENKAWAKFIAMRKEVQLSDLATEARPLRVKAWADVWLKRRQDDVKPTTFRAERSVIQKWLIPTLGTKLIQELTPADLRRIIDQAKDAGISATHQRYIIRIAQQCLKDAKADGQNVPDAVLLMRKPAARVSDRNAIPLDAVAAIMGEAAKLAHVSRWQVAFLTGMRQGEMLGLTWDSVDFDAGVINVDWQLQELTMTDGEYVVAPQFESRQLAGSYHLLRPKSKAGRRIIPMSEDVRAALTAWKKQGGGKSPHGLVWPHKAGPRSNKRDRAEWYALQDAAQVRHESGRRYLVHEIRHSTVSLLLAAGVSPFVIQAIVGHSKLVENYVHVDAAQARSALALLEALPELEG